MCIRDQYYQCSTYNLRLIYTKTRLKTQCFKKNTWIPVRDLKDHKCLKHCLRSAEDFAHCAEKQPLNCDHRTAPPPSTGHSHSHLGQGHPSLLREQNWLSYDVRGNFHGLESVTKHQRAPKHPQTHFPPKHSMWPTVLQQMKSVVKNSKKLLPVECLGISR